MASYTNDTKPNLATTSVSAGMPYGLLLALTYGVSIMSTGESYTNDTKNSNSYSNDIKNSNSYSNDTKPS